MTWLQEVQWEMARARSLHPSNHLLLSAMTEEAGEVVKAVLDHMAGKGTLAEVRAELIQTAAMVGRLLEEGDPVHGLPAALCLDEVRHCSHVDETVNAQINDGRIIDAVIEKPEAPAPARSGILTGEAYWKNLAESLISREAELDTRVEELEAQLERLLSLVSDDSLAITFQSMGQYRTFLKSEIRAALAPGEGREDV